MLFQAAAAALTFALVNGNEDQTDEAYIYSCVINNIHNEDQQKCEFEFLGYNTTDVVTFEMKEGEPNYCH